MSDFLEKMIDEGYDPDLVNHHLTGEFGNAVIAKLQELEERIEKLEGYMPPTAAMYNAPISSLGATYTKPVYEYMTDIPEIHRAMNG